MHGSLYINFMWVETHATSRKQLCWRLRYYIMSGVFQFPLPSRPKPSSSTNFRNFKARLLIAHII